MDKYALYNGQQCHTEAAGPSAGELGPRPALCSSAAGCCEQQAESGAAAQALATALFSAEAGKLMV